MSKMILNYSSCAEVNSSQVETAPRYYRGGQDLKCHAWSPELNRAVTASEIWHLMFGEKIFNTELSFYCVDTQCQARLILRNCQAYMSDDDAQFRLYPRSRHHCECTYIVEQQQKKNKMQSQRRHEAMHARPRPRGWNV